MTGAARRCKLLFQDGPLPFTGSWKVKELTKLASFYGVTIASKCTLWVLLNFEQRKDNDMHFVGLTDCEIKEAER